MIAWTATPVADVTWREASLVLLSGIDVTERKRQDEEIRASRARIIEAADDARRVLERNLHDGAQQRLVALSVSLRLAEARTATDPAEAAAIIEAAREELAAALEELRELARGIHPAVLTDRGLAAAVEALVIRTPLPVTVTMPSERLPAPIEAAAYYVVSEAVTNIVKYAGATAIEVTVETGDELRHRHRHRRRLRRRRPRRGDGPARAARPRGGARRDARRRQPGRPGHDGSWPRSRSTHARSWPGDAASCHCSRLGSDERRDRHRRVPPLRHRGVDPPRARGGRRTTRRS